MDGTLIPVEMAVQFWYEWQTFLAPAGGDGMQAKGAEGNTGSPNGDCDRINRPWNGFKGIETIFSNDTMLA